MFSVKIKILMFSHFRFFSRSIFAYTFPLPNSVLTYLNAFLPKLRKSDITFLGLQ
jgi:hypothetical protein